MADTIQLLPDHIANQIAAGEVIQRPASAVKELLENAVDAGATEIRLIINDAGKALIQVIDNGKGMNETDARMCFERHATSKIAKIEDLFQIRTMGFRGEALASIAAVAQVELKTKRAEDELGTYIEVENSTVIKQEPAALGNGTSIAMKNLFFNVPARRNFLKSNAAEMRHIIDEFIRVSMSFPEIQFTLTSNGQQVFYLEKGTLKQRIVQLLGTNYNSKLVSVQEHTDYLNIYGFVGKPETAKKTRGDQYFFVNNRFIRSGYLHHAVMQAFQDLIPSDGFPLYVLFIDLDPAQVDINVHPTKQEIKFEDEKIVYAFVQAAVKHALAQFSVAPSLEFDLDPTIQQLDAVNKPFTENEQSAATNSSLFQSFTQRFQAHVVNPGKSNMPGFEKKEERFESLMDQLRKPVADESSVTIGQFDHASFQPKASAPIAHLQLHQRYIIASTASGFILIHQGLAHERVLYEKFAAANQQSRLPSQRSLFPVSIDLAPADVALMTELTEPLQELGYLIEPFGNNSFVIQGTPADLEQGNEKHIIEQLLEQYKHFANELKVSKREQIMRHLSRQHAIRAGKSLSQKEMQQLVDDLFNCSQPGTTASGQPTFIEYNGSYLEKMFGQ